jgi:hypothetical protein
MVWSSASTIRTLFSILSPLWYRCSHGTNGKYSQIMPEIQCLLYLSCRDFLVNSSI